MYYSEIAKIIEAGLEKDKDKVRNYSLLLAGKLKEDGEIRMGNRILKILEKRRIGGLVTDSLIAPPVDQESRMSIISVSENKDIPDLVLADSVIEKLKDFQDTIKVKDKMSKLGLEFDMSLLLYGDPGCGKTSIAYFLANELELPLVTARLDTLISSLLGNTAKNIRRIFDYAKRQPCILFLDEFDAIAKARDDKQETGELKRVVNSLLQNIDEYSKDGILIAATNHQELLDSAIWRRFQSVIQVPKPNEKQISKFLDKLFFNLKRDFVGDVKKNKIIQEIMSGLSYSDIKNISQNTIKKYFIKEKESIEFIDLITEAYKFKNHNNLEVDELIKFLNDVGISQTKISKKYKISMRQVKNYLKGVI